MHIHKTIKPYTCEVCPSNETHRDILPSVGISCSKVCSKAYTQSSNLCRHKRIHAREIKCPTCSITFPNGQFYIRHKKTCSTRTHLNEETKCKVIGAAATQMYHSLSTNSTKQAFAPATDPVEAWTMLHKQILLHLYQQQQQQQQQQHQQEQCLALDKPLDLTVPKKSSETDESISSGSSSGSTVLSDEEDDDDGGDEREKQPTDKHSHLQQIGRAHV